MKNLLKYFLPLADGDGEGGDQDGARPDWCPEKFFDADLGGVRAEPMAKAFVELESKLRSSHDTIVEEVNAERLAQAPETYEWKTPDIEMPEGMSMDLSSDDPLVSWFNGFAKENGLTQEQYDGAIKNYIDIEIAGLPKIEDEVAKLGDYGQDRLLKVHNWLDTKLDANEMKSVSSFLQSADSIQALEKLMKTSGPGNFDGDTGGSAVTLEELRTLQNDPRYWQTKDPAFIKKVEAGYQRLYGKG